MHTSAVTVRIKMAEGCEDLMPKKAHPTDAAYDLHSRQDIVILPRRHALVPTGVFLALPSTVEAQVRPRSGLALKHDITVTNSPGTIDSGYRGEVGVILFNLGTDYFSIHRGDRIAQMVITELPRVVLETVRELDTSDRGDKGFGSTGK